MLSYQHGYHAGNFADVHKHTALCLLLKLIGASDKLVTYIDTHAGRGLYDLNAEQSLKTGEFKDGISALLNKEVQATALADYIHHVKNFEQSTYPGSPALIRAGLKDNHRALFFELHPGEFAHLEENFKEDRRIRCLNLNAQEQLVDYLPGRKNNGLILMDPSFELKEEYDTIADLANLAAKRCPDFTVVVWYPLLPEARHEDLKRSLKNATFYELIGPQKERGMYGTGLGVINPAEGFAQAFAPCEKEMQTLLFG